MTRYYWGGLIVFGILCDLVSKYWALGHLRYGGEKLIIPGVLSFQLVFNYGAAYGIFQNQRLFLISVSVALLIVALFFRRWFVTSIYSATGLAFIVMGTVGNLVDRVYRGYVVDFINIGIIPVFNIADILINIGVICFFVELFINRDSKTS